MKRGLSVLLICMICLSLLPSAYAEAEAIVEEDPVIMDEPAVTNRSNPFKDVKSSDPYYKAVLWAVQNGITSGTSKTTFSPKDNCTRYQLAVFLYRFSGM